MHFKKITTKDNVGTMTNVYALYRGIRDQRVQWYIKILALLIVAYVVSPIDLIPDFIPVIGLLDEVILVPIAIACVIRLIPRDIYNELVLLEQDKVIDKKFIYIGCAMVVTAWISITAIVYSLII